MRKIVYSIFIILACTVPEATLCKAGEVPPVWYKYAREYVETHARLINEANTSNGNVLDLLKGQEAIVKKLEELPSPSVEELNQLIQSPRLEEREAALATAFILKLSDAGLVKTILSNYEREQGFLAKFYSHRALGNLTTSQLKVEEEHLFNILQKEKDESLIIAGMQNVVRLGRGKRTMLFVQYMKHGSDGLLRACTVSLAKLGRPELEGMKARLAKQGAKKATAFLDRYGEATLREVAHQGDK